MSLVPILLSSLIDDLSTLLNKFKQNIVSQKLLFLAVLLIAILMFGCESPRNNRVIPDTQLNQNAYTPMRLKTLDYGLVAVWTKGPYPEVFKNSKLMVLIYNQEGDLTDLTAGQSLGFFAFMPSMGHGAEDAGYFERLSEGVYQNSSVVFQMSGDWQMELSILDSSFETLDEIVWLEFI